MYTQTQTERHTHTHTHAQKRNDLLLKFNEYGFHKQEHELKTGRQKSERQLDIFILI